MEFNFKYPIDGDVLFTEADGVLVDEKLQVTVQVFAPKDLHITINKNITEYEEGIYSATIALDSYRNAIEAFCVESGEMKTIYVYWFKNGYQTYRLGIDDVIICFQNIYNNQNSYKSIFEDPFLSIFRELHEKYDTRVHMHIYYETVDKSFNLSMFPDKYKEEFSQNGDWLKFTFHSRCDQPDSPYKYASYDLVMEEGKMVENEIRRFAGSNVLSNITSQHWADSNIYGTRAFRNLGFRVIDGYFLFDENGDPYVAYYLNKEQTAHAHLRDFWVDNKEDIIFVKDDIIINEVDLDQIEQYMDDLKAAPDHAFMYLLIHEQYFYKDYVNYQSDYKEKIFKTIQWCHNNGYRPVAISDIAFEKDLNEQ